MSQDRFSKQVAVVMGFLLYVLVAPRLALAQSVAPAGGPPPTIAAPSATASRPGAPQATDIFAGLNLSDGQKAKITEIRQNTRARMLVVSKDEKLTADQKEAMLVGLQRMEAGDIFNQLTPEQQKEVRKKLAAQRAADQQQRAQRSSSVAPH
jgi:Spy/CpxP family protein refolding chaperone